MGLAAARRMVKKGYYTILCGRTVSKLEAAVKELHELGERPRPSPATYPTGTAALSWLPMRRSWAM